MAQYARAQRMKNEMHQRLSPKEEAMDAGLMIACPACARVCRDELELLDEGRFHAMRCAGCKLDYLLLVACCASCQAASVHTWIELPLEEAHCRRYGSERI